MIVTGAGHHDNASWPRSSDGTPAVYNSTDAGFVTNAPMTVPAYHFNCLMLLYTFSALYLFHATDISLRRIENMNSVPYTPSPSPLRHSSAAALILQAFFYLPPCSIVLRSPSCSPCDKSWAMFVNNVPVVEMRRSFTVSPLLPRPPPLCCSGSHVNTTEIWY